MTTVPGVAAGGGCGLSERKRGWTFASSMFVGVLGREECGLLVMKAGAGAGRSSRSNAGLEGKGPSRARAGETGRLPGIGSRRVPRPGANGRSESCPCVAISRACWSTLDVSQASKPSEWVMEFVRVVFPEWKLPDSRKEEALDRSLVRDVMGRTTCWKDDLQELRDGCTESVEKVGEARSLEILSSLMSRVIGGDCSRISWPCVSSFDEAGRLGSVESGSHRVVATMKMAWVNVERAQTANFAAIRSVDAPEFFALTVSI